MRLVFKQYLPKVRPVAVYGLEALVRARNALHPRQREVFDVALNWPRRVVTDDESGAAGVVLPLLDDSFFFELRKPSGAVEKRSAEGQYLQMSRQFCAGANVPFPDLDQRLALCRSLIYAIGLLHRAGVVYGDLSARNFLYTLSPRPRVVLVDCDATRLESERAALGNQPHSPHWQPPEALAAAKRGDKNGFNVQNKQTDRFKLGLAILRILSPGALSHNRDPSVVRGALPPHLYRLLELSLAVDPAQRPEPKTWWDEWNR